MKKIQCQLSRSVRTPPSDHVAGPWSISILVAAAHGPVRFTELERSIEGISRRMLTLNLRRLEPDGLLTRTVHPTVPPKVEYNLTSMARELHSYLTGLVERAEQHRGSIAQARTAYDSTAAAAQAGQVHPWPGGAIGQ
ncbi:winged helix-turn-helix transcriptional regulator [Streptomyces sp. NPDC013978]|uniref:winged helix-turn-helix transcriptional regulator n=1 Tax=Streptomyces sp. NPDC013978 TaxID=3364869 RepID=UPI0036FEDD36